MARCLHTCTIDLGYTPRVPLTFADVHPLRQWFLQGPARGHLIRSPFSLLHSCSSVGRPGTPSSPRPDRPRARVFSLSPDQRPRVLADHTAISTILQSELIPSPSPSSLR